MEQTPPTNNLPQADLLYSVSQSKTPLWQFEPEATAEKKELPKKGMAKTFHEKLFGLDFDRYISENAYDLFRPKNGTPADFLVALYSAACSERFPAIFWNDSDHEWFLVNFPLLGRCCRSCSPTGTAEIDAFKRWMEVIGFHRVEEAEFPGPHLFAFFHPDFKENEVLLLARLVEKRKKTGCEENLNYIDQIFKFNRL